MEIVESDSTIGITSCPSSISQGSASNNKKFQKEHISNESKLIADNQYIKGQSSSITSDNGTTRHTNLKIQEVSSTVRLKEYQNLDSEDGDVRTTSPM